VGVTNEIRYNDDKCLLVSISSKREIIENSEHFFIGGDAESEAADI
jgi:hypothetical protein